MSNVFFRSDTRHPATRFVAGFRARDGSSTGPSYRYPYGAQAAPDVDPASTISVTRDFMAAARFPVLQTTSETWIYVLDLPVSQVFNVQDFQYRHVVDYQRVAGDGSADRDAYWAMYAQERAVQRIAGTAIVGAIRIQRRLGHTAQEEFRPVELVTNPLYPGNTTTRSMVRRMFRDMINDNAWLAVPTRSSGIVSRSTA
jgi:hypothetical protein